jgi:dipeptidyl aminopeptidase/acylaminoacyl peptidase
MTYLIAGIVGIFAFAVTITLLVFVIGPVMLLNPRRRNEDWYRQRGEPLTPADLQLPYREMWVPGADGVQLHAWLIQRIDRPRGTIIYFHGVGDNKISGIRLAKVFYDHGYNVFLYDSRTHGLSGGKYCTYGYHEKFDAQKAIDFLFQIENLTVGKIGIFGTSMGAAIAVQTAAIEPRICALAAESCFTNLRTITVDYQKRLIRMPWHFLRNVVMKRSEFLAKFRHHDVSPLKSLPSVHIPILFVHGKEDTFIKYQYSKELFAAAHEPKDLYLVEGAHHTNIHAVVQKAYEEKLISFFGKWMT